MRIGAAANATNRNFTVTAGQATTIDLGVIAAGALTVTPSAFTQACGSVTTSTVGTKVSADMPAVPPASVTLVPSGALATFVLVSAHCSSA